MQEGRWGQGLTEPVDMEGELIKDSRGYRGEGPRRGKKGWQQRHMSSIFTERGKVGMDVDMFMGIVKVRS